MRNEVKCLVIREKAKKPLGTTRFGREDNTVYNLPLMGCESVTTH
jgi:hypothetical protein